MSNNIITTINATTKTQWQANTLTLQLGSVQILLKNCIIILVLDPPHLPKTITRIINWGRTPPPPHNIILECSLSSDKAHNNSVKIVSNTGTLWQSFSQVYSLLCVHYKSLHTEHCWNGSNQGNGEAEKWTGSETLEPFSGKWMQ